MAERENGSKQEKKGLPGEIARVEVWLHSCTDSEPRELKYQTMNIKAKDHHIKTVRRYRSGIRHACTPECASLAIIL
jgi:hypothetical protein